MDRGTLLLADITGYTAFLQAVGAAHAADMAAGTFVPKAYPLLTTLIDGIVEQVSPPFVLSKLEGDAVFAFGPDGTLNVRGQAVLDCLSACPDVTISHLLLKNHAADLVGQSAYALVTDPAATKLDIPLDGTLPITEEYEHYPPVRASVLALS